jgi:hypothetical protein
MLYYEAPYWQSSDIDQCIRVTFGQLERLIKLRPRSGTDQVLVDLSTILLRTAQQLDRIIDKRRFAILTDDTILIICELIIHSTIIE